MPRLRAAIGRADGDWEDRLLANRQDHSMATSSTVQCVNDEKLDEELLLPKKIAPKTSRKLPRRYSLIAAIMSLLAIASLCLW